MGTGANFIRDVQPMHLEHNKTYHSLIFQSFPLFLVFATEDLQWSVCTLKKRTVLSIGASVAQWSERSPFTSEVAGSLLSENFLNVTRAQCSTHVKRVSQHSAESRGFSPGTPVSSHREFDRVG